MLQELLSIIVLVTVVLLYALFDDAFSVISV